MYTHFVFLLGERFGNKTCLVAGIKKTTSGQLCSSSSNEGIWII